MAEHALGNFLLSFLVWAEQNYYIARLFIELDDRDAVSLSGLTQRVNPSYDTGTFCQCGE